MGIVFYVLSISAIAVMVSISLASVVGKGSAVTCYLPAPEVSLILLVETILGPIWVWLAIGEVPLETTLFAGVLIVGTLFVHTLMSLKADQQIKNPAAVP